MNPSIVRLAGKTYIANGAMHEAWEGITLDEARELYPVKKFVPKPKPEPKKNVWQVVSSKGDKYYTVTYRNDSYSCSCPGYGWRRKCRHIEGVKAQ